MSLSDSEVAEYLNHHPEFFDHHPHLKPSAAHAQVVSLTERQLPQLRDRIRHLEDQLLELLALAKENDALSQKVQTFALALLRDAGSTEIKAKILSALKALFGIDEAVIRLWASPWANADLPVLQEFQNFVSQMKEPLCGEHPLYEVNRWFGDAAHALKSYAVAPIGQPPMGVLVLGGQTPERFGAESGTLFITRVTELIAAALEGSAR